MEIFERFATNVLNTPMYVAIYNGQNNDCQQSNNISITDTYIIEEVFPKISNMAASNGKSRAGTLFVISMIELCSYEMYTYNIM
jgi:hypothetical protein